MRGQALPPRPASAVILFCIPGPWSFLLTWAAESDEAEDHHYGGEPGLSPTLLRGIRGTEFIEELKAYEQ